MPVINEPNPENRGNRKKSSEEENHDARKEVLEPKPEEDEPSKESSGFMKILKKFGYSVWLIVMIIGAGLAFIAAIFLV